MKSADDREVDALTRIYIRAYDRALLTAWPSLPLENAQRAAESVATEVMRRSHELPASRS